MNKMLDVEDFKRLRDSFPDVSERKYMLDALVEHKIACAVLVAEDKSKRAFAKVMSKFIGLLPVEEIEKEFINELKK